MSFQPLFRLGNVPVAPAGGGYRSLLAFWAGGAANRGAVAPVQQGNWDTTDPLFYDWWRRQRQALEAVKTEAEEQPLQVETIQAVEAATSIADVEHLAVSVALLARERVILNQLILDYQQYLDDEEEAEFLLLH